MFLSIKKEIPTNGLSCNPSDQGVVVHPTVTEGQVFWLLSFGNVFSNLPVLSGSLDGEIGPRHPAAVS